MDPISRTISLGAAGAGGPSYWIATLGGAASSGSAEVAQDVAVDSAGNVYIVGYTASVGAGVYDFLIAKYNSSGAIQWQRTLGTSGYEFGYGIGLDNSGNVYVVGQGQGGLGQDDFLIAKYNSSGTIQWQIALGGVDTDEGRGIAVDGSGNCYVIGRCGVNNNDYLIAKYNSSGSIQWQRTLGGTGTDEGLAIAVDSSGNVYVTGKSNSSGGSGYNFLIAKYSSSGTIQWQRTLSSSTNDTGYGIAVDSSGNVYVTGDTYVSGTDQYLVIAKYDSSGTIQWQRRLRLTGRSAGQGIAVDSSNNVYVAGFTNATGAGGYDVLIAKYDSSGTIQWQRTLGGSNNDYGRGISVDNSGNVYVVGSVTNPTTGDDALIVKLPDDGSLTGTYGSFTYAASSLNDQVASLSSQNASNTSSASSFSSSASSWTDAASSLPSSTTTL